MKQPIYKTLGSVLAYGMIIGLSLSLISFRDYNVPEQTMAGPNLNCKDSTVVAINADTTYLMPDSLVNGRDFGVTLQVRRMKNDYCNAQDTVPSNSIRICCSDVGRTIMVEVIATADGMSNSCMVRVVVQNKLAPVIDSSLPDLTISCATYKKIASNLDTLGRYVTDIDQVRQLSNGDFEFTDGLVTRVCGNLRVKEIVLDSTKCGFGKLIRRFIIKDINTPKDSLVIDQLIVIINDDPLTFEDIVFPNDTTVMGCFKAPFAKSLGGLPTFDILNKCAMPAYNSFDMVFDDPNSGCPFIMRTWKVMDMCTFTPDMRIGYWEHVQNIYTMDTIAPKFTKPCLDTMIVNIAGGCTIPVSLSIDGIDNCTAYKDLVFSYELYKGNDLILFGSKKAINADLAQGNYTIKWSIDDRCGNIATCQYAIIALEGKKPTPLLLQGVVVTLPKGCDAYVAASIFNKGSYDNCTPGNDLKFSFSPDINDDTLVLNCSNLGIQDTSIYVTDLAGNQSFATVTINLQDPENHCPAMAPIAITGQIMTDDEMFVPQVSISLEGAEQQRLVETDDKGRFELTNLERHSDYELHASKNADFKAGINVLDIIALQRHILGIKKLNTGYRMIAADVDGSEVIDIKDIIELRKIILGVKEAPIGIPSWRFIPNTVQNVSLNPWPIQEMAFYKNLENDTHMEFRAIKMGDVDGSISKQLSGRSLNKATFVTEDQFFKTDEIVTLSIKLENGLRDLEGMQFQLKVDPSILKIEKTTGLNGLSETDLLFDKSMLKVVKSYANKTDIASGEPILKIELRALKNGNLGQALFLEETDFESILQSGDNIKQLSLNIKGEKSEVITVHQNAPNPFSDYTIASFTLAEDLPVEISIFDQTGKMMFHEYKPYSKGTHTFNIDDTQLKGTKGIFLLHIETAEVSEVRKLLRLK